MWLRMISRRRWASTAAISRLPDPGLTFNDLADVYDHPGRGFAGIIDADLPARLLDRNDRPGVGYLAA